MSDYWDKIHAERNADSVDRLRRENAQLRASRPGGLDFVPLSDFTEMKQRLESEVARLLAAQQELERGTAALVAQLAERDARIAELEGRG